MPKPRIDYVAIERFVLVLMYDAFVSDAPMSFDLTRVRKALPVPKNLIDVTLSALEEEELIVEVQPANQYGGKLARYELTDDGRRRVEEMPDETYDMALAALAGGTAANAFQVSSAPDIGPAPESWVPLPIEVGDPELADVRTSLATLVELIECDNGYASEHPNERAEVLSGLNAAVTMFREASQVGYSAFVAYVWWPLERIINRFPADTLVGSAGKLLKDALASWIKAKTGNVLDDIFNISK